MPRPPLLPSDSLPETHTPTAAGRQGLALAADRRILKLSKIVTKTIQSHSKVGYILGRLLERRNLQFLNSKRLNMEAPQIAKKITNPIYNDDSSPEASKRFRNAPRGSKWLLESPHQTPKRLPRDPPMDTPRGHQKTPTGIL